MSESIGARGRPRSEARRVAILEAAFAVLAARGYAGMAFEAVAEAAGSAKTTLYRWWPSKADLAVAAFLHAAGDGLAVPDTGSTREDFRVHVMGVTELLRAPRGGVLAVMLGGALTEPRLAQLLRERWFGPRQTWGIERMQRAVARGECRPGVDIEAALGVLYGPIYMPLVFGLDVPTEAQMQAHLALALPVIFV